MLKFLNIDQPNIPNITYQNNNSGDLRNSDIIELRTFIGLLFHSVLNKTTKIFPQYLQWDWKRYFSLCYR